MKGIQAAAYNGAWTVFQPYAICQKLTSMIYQYAFWEKLNYSEVGTIFRIYISCNSQLSEITNLTKYQLPKKDWNPSVILSCTYEWDHLKPDRISSPQKYWGFTDHL